MNLTNEVLEMWEADARRGATDITAANARIVRLIQEDRDSVLLLAVLTGRLSELDPEFEASIAEAVEEVQRAA